MRRALLVLASTAAMAAAAIGLGAAPAGAALDPPCMAAGTLESDGVRYDASSLPGVVTVQPKDSVVWEGSIPGGGPDGKGPERQIKGEVKVDFPFGSYTVGSWEKSSTTYSNGDTYDWDLWSGLAGVEVSVTGSHSEGGGKACVGSAKVKIDGTSPIAFVSATLSVLSIVGVYMSIRPVRITV